MKDLYFGMMQLLIQQNKKTYIELEERGLQFGDGVYEVMRLYNGNFHLLDPHITRLYRSLEEIELSLPFSKAELITLLYKLIESNNFYEDGTIYLQVSRGVQARTHAFSYDIPRQSMPISQKRKDRLYGLNMVYVLYQNQILAGFAVILNH